MLQLKGNVSYLNIYISQSQRIHTFKINTYIHFLLELTTFKGRMGSKKYSARKPTHLD